jgi:hypothetical protein
VTSAIITAKIAGAPKAHDCIGSRRQIPAAGEEFGIVATKPEIRAFGFGLASSLKIA